MQVRAALTMQSRYRGHLARKAALSVDVTALHRQLHDLAAKKRGFSDLLVWLGFLCVLVGWTTRQNDVGARFAVQRSLAEGVLGVRFGDGQNFALDDIGYVPAIYDFLHALVGDFYDGPAGDACAACALEWHFCEPCAA